MSLKIPLAMVFSGYVWVLSMLLCLTRILLYIAGCWSFVVLTLLVRGGIDNILLCLFGSVYL